MDIYKRLVRYVVPFRGQLFLAFICTLFFTMFNALVSAVTYIVFNGFFNGGKVLVKDLPFLPPDQVFEFSATLIPVMIVVIVLFRGIFDFLSKYMMANVGLRAVMAVRNDLYAHMIRLSMDFYSRGRTGDLISRIMSDVAYIQGAITEVIVDIFKQPLNIIMNLFMAFYWGGKFALIGALIFPLVAIPIVYLGSRLRKITRNMQEKMADITAILEETITGIRIVKSFNMEEKEIAKFNDTNKRVFSFLKKMLKVTVIQRPLVEVMGAVGAALAIGVGMKHLPPDRFVAFITTMFLLYEPIKKLSKVNSSIQQSIGAGTRIFEIMDRPTEIVDVPNAIPFSNTVEKVTFSHVEFAYEKGKNVLKDINFEVGSGEITALVGASGSGKTTLVNLILRFYDPDSGQVQINGRNIQDYQFATLRAHIGLVPQETILFNGTLAENIAYGRPGASSEEILKAAQMAYAHEFIEELPNGFDTQIGERGVMLSGGQRQRISIARAILKNPPILILDEATSQLDSASEREVQKAFENLMQGKTVFVIAHRLATIKKADRILVFDAGALVQQGTEAELLKQGGVYQHLHELQFNS